MMGTLNLPLLKVIKFHVGEIEYTGETIKYVIFEQEINQLNNIF